MDRLRHAAAAVRRNYERFAARFETGVQVLERRYTPLGRFSPGPFEGWSFLWQPAVLGFFGIRFLAINGSSPIGIAFSLFVVAIAALNLVLDFDFIERGVNLGAPKYMEWYGAFGIIITLVWLYLEILNLLSKLRGSRN